MTALDRYGQRLHCGDRIRYGTFRGTIIAGPYPDDYVEVKFDDTDIAMRMLPEDLVKEDT